jgi:hypothetical protein
MMLAPSDARERPNSALVSDNYFSPLRAHCVAAQRER